MMAGVEGINKGQFVAATLSGSGEAEDSIELAALSAWEEDPEDEQKTCPI